MGRRKKEPEQVHRGTMTAAAARLFETQGVESTTMDQIAREAGYSKATLYVYFRDKKEIVDTLVLESMNYLQECLDTAISGTGTIFSRYNALCWALADYQEQYPYYFEASLKEIHMDYEKGGALPVEQEIFKTGEAMNEQIAGFLREGISSGVLRKDLELMKTVFLFWSSLSGVILMAANKKSYFEITMKLTRKEFLDYCFQTLYSSIAKKEEQT